MTQPKADLRVSLLAIPDTFMSCLAGLLDTLIVARDVADGRVPFDPKVRLRLERELVISADGTLVMSGASSAWHDLALYLVSRFSGPAIARSVAKFFMLQWHAEGQTPYIPFAEPMEHGDSAVLAAQAWLQGHWSDPGPVEVMIARSGLSARNFARRFHRATGHAPLAYVQQVRIEHAKQMLETGAAAIDEISAAVGYEDPSFFRRIFKRIVGLRPVDYRRKFSRSRLPEEVSG